MIRADAICANCGRRNDEHDNGRACPAPATTVWSERRTPTTRDQAYIALRDISNEYQLCLGHEVDAWLDKSIKRLSAIDFGAITGARK